MIRLLITHFFFFYKCVSIYLLKVSRCKDVNIWKFQTPTRRIINFISSRKWLIRKLYIKFRIIGNKKSKKCTLKDNAYRTKFTSQDSA
jgi:hypothetical protein